MSVPPAVTASAADRADAVLALRGVTVTRGQRALVEGADLQAAPGEFIALVGPNGAGKSSLLRAISGEWHAQGTIELFGRGHGGWRRPELARRMAVMAQASTLSFDFLVEEVVRLGRLPHRGSGIRSDHEIVEAVLADLDLAAFRHRRYTTLSGGERQRVQFARVLAQIWEAPARCLLLLDEPTSALDLAQQKAVLDIARARAQLGTTVIAVMHDLNLAVRYADRMVMMRGGHIVHDGAPPATLTRSAVDRVFGVAAEVEVARCDGRPMVVLTPGGGTAPAADRP
jgi:iron complex transport system ATP-binding protein